MRSSAFRHRLGIAGHQRPALNQKGMTMRRTIVHGSFVALLGLGTAGLALAQTPPVPSDTVQVQDVPNETRGDRLDRRERNAAAITAMTSRSRGANCATGKMKRTTNVADRVDFAVPDAGGSCRRHPLTAPFEPRKRTVRATPAPR
jgi:hypothetical protein